MWADRCLLTSGTTPSMKQSPARVTAATGSTEAIYGEAHSNCGGGDRNRGRYKASRHHEAEQAEALPDNVDIVVSDVVEGLPSDDDPPIPPNVTED